MNEVIDIDEKKKEKKKKEIETTVGEAEDLMTSPMLDTLLKRSMPFKFNYWLNRIIKKVRKELEDYFDKKKELIDEHVELDDKGEPKTVVRGNIQQFKFKTAEDDEVFRKRVASLREDPLKLPGIYKLKVDLDDHRFNELNGYEVQLLMPLIEDIDV